MPIYARQVFLAMFLFKVFNIFFTFHFSNHRFVSLRQGITIVVFLTLEIKNPISLCLTPPTLYSSRKEKVENDFIELKTRRTRKAERKEKEPKNCRVNERTKTTENVNVRKYRMTKQNT